MTKNFELTDKQREGHALIGQGQRHTMIFGGSRSGKTFLFCRTIAIRAHRFPATRHIILRQKQNAVKQSIFLDTMPKVFALCFPQLKFTEEKSLTRWLLPWNGSEIWCGGLDDKERIEKILGNEYATIYFNECSQIPFQSIETGLTRLAQKSDQPDFKQRAFYDLNPVGNRHWSYRMFIEKRHPLTSRPLQHPENYEALQMNPYDNRENLSAEYLQELESSSDRSRKRFLLGEYVPEMEGALWQSATLERGRLDQIQPSQLAEMGISRVVIGVDPSGASGDDQNADAIGIIVMGRQGGTKGRGFVLEDGTLLAHPKVWAKRIADLSDKWGADCIVAEKNFGGEMVRHTIKMANPMANVKDVVASRGKHVRAEPIAALYEEEANSSDGVYTGRVHHCGRFDQLEDELCNTTTAGYVGALSPNRMDALVWAATELFGKTPVSPDAFMYGGTFARFPREVV